jgi:hypothetical protein
MINNTTGRDIIFSQTIDFNAKTELSITYGLSQVNTPVKLFHETGITKRNASIVDRVRKLDNLKIFLIQARLLAV